MSGTAPSPATVTESSVVVGRDGGDEIRMAYSDAGCRGAAWCVVLLHGLFDSRRTWRDLTPHLVAAGCRVVAPDLVGFGDSSRPPLASLPAAQRYALDTHVGFLRRFVQALGLEAPILMGNSLGGGILLRALGAPWPPPAPRVRALVLEAAVGYSQRVPPLLQMFAGRAGALLLHPWVQRLALATGATRALVGRTYARVFHDPRAVPPDLVEHAVAALRVPRTLYAYRETVRHMMPAHMAGFPDSYRHLELPTLILWGRDDRIVPPLFALRLEAEIPGADLRVLDDCGHAPHLEVPMETAVLLRDWLRRRLGPAPGDRRGPA